MSSETEDNQSEPFKGYNKFIESNFIKLANRLVELSEYNKKDPNSLPMQDYSVFTFYEFYKLDLTDSELALGLTTNGHLIVTYPLEERKLLSIEFIKDNMVDIVVRTHKETTTTSMNLSEVTSFLRDHMELNTWNFKNSNSK